MGVVLLAEDTVVGRVVALKVLTSAGNDVRDRVVREARAAGVVGYEHLVTLYAVETPADRPPYLVMEYVDGITFQARIERSAVRDLREAARVVHEAAEGLAAAHQRGLVHRDVKPANILLDGKGRAKVADFGLARTTDAAATVSAPPGSLVGTLAYMSPEQMSEPSRVGPASDVYALGVSLYQALTGEVPFRGTPAQVVRQVREDDPAPPRRLNEAVPRDLVTVCLKCLEKNPSRRYADASGLADDLHRFLNGEPVVARPVGPAGRAWRWCRRKPVVAGLAAGIVAALLTGLAATSWQ
jgi:serine/threonine protein kinase